MNMTLITQKLKNEIVFTISLLLAVITSLFTAPQLSYINFKVVALLFNLMIIIAAFRNLFVMDKISLWILSKCHSARLISMIFIVITFLSSMLVTNDVALITFVPLAIFTFKKIKIDPMKTVILQTLAANIGSSLTPMGNPQNLFLFTFYKLNSFQFFSITFPFVFFGFLWILLLNSRVSKERFELAFDNIPIKNTRKVAIYLVFFILAILSVFNIIDYRYTLLITLIFVICMDTHILKQVDYFLLATFIFFFIFIGNVSNIDLIKETLERLLLKPGMPYFSSIILSQVISNVPCSILISSFTDNWREVLLGVNIGGMGTLIASLASLISYKIYFNYKPENKKIYLKKFHIYNFVSLFIFAFIMYLYFVAFIKLN